MGSSHGKIAIATESPTLAANRCYSGGTPPPPKAPSTVETTAVVKQPRLRLHRLLRRRNEATPNAAGGSRYPEAAGGSAFDENKPLPAKPEKKAKKARRSLFKSKLDREVYENLYSELPMQTIVLEDIAPSTSIANGDHSGQRMRREPRIVKEHFDHRVLVKYTVKALIGKGSFSRVVQVEERGSGAPFAMKLVGAKEGRGPFENELAILQRLHHPNLIRLHEVIRSSTRLYLVMELATGGELYERIVAKGKFSERETGRTIGQILEGLAYLHRLGITHRDLKPENLLYTRDPESCPDARILVTDFGLAFQATAPGQRMHETCGTPEYIAPEVLMRIPYDCKIDLWSTGVIAYILLSGIMPFDSESRTRLYRQIIRGKYHFYPEFFAGVSSEALGFVAALLDTEAELRLSAEDALVHPWLRPFLRPPPQPKLHPRGGTSTLRSASFKAIGGGGPASQRRTPPRGSPPHSGEISPSGSGLSSSRHHRPQAPAPAMMEAAPPRRRRGTSKSPSPIERTRSSRSIRSVARSDHTHRVRPQEVERLWEDPELRRLVFHTAKAKVGGGQGRGYQSDSGHRGRPTVITVNGNEESRGQRRPASTTRGGTRRALAPSVSDNYCVVASSLPSQPPPHPHTKDYGLV